MRRVFCLFLLCLLLFSGFARSVWIFTDTVILNNGYELHHKIATEYTFIDIETNYTILDSHNITYVNNVTSQHSVIEQMGWYSTGNYTTRINATVYKPSDWTVGSFYFRIKTATGVITSNTSGSQSTINSTHARYTMTYNPDNSIPEAQLGYFDVDIFIYASNSTLYYTGNRTFQNVFKVYRLNPPSNGASKWSSATKTVNLTWTNGTHTKKNVVVRLNGTAYPTTPYVGYRPYNGTRTWFNETANTSRGYSVFSWNETTRSYSEPLNIGWGAMTIFRIHNESAPRINLTSVNLLITNTDGSITYYNAAVTPPVYLNMSQIPFGTNTIFVLSKTKYEQRVYHENLVLNSFYNLSFYLPPVIAPGGGSSEENNSHLYQITIINKNNDPLQDVSVVIKRYINTTGSYEIMSSPVTDGAGQCTVWLRANTLYKVFLSKTGYEDQIADWITDAIIFTKQFTMEYTSPVVVPPLLFNEEVHFTGTIDRATHILTLSYIDNTSNTTKTDMIIYENNPGIIGEIVYATDTRYSDNSFTYSLSINNNNSYRVVILINHKLFGVHTLELLFENITYEQTITTPAKFNLLFTLNYGTCPFGWSNVAMWVIALGVLFSFGRRDTYMSAILLGVLFLFINWKIGFNTVFATGAGIGFPVLFIVIGILMLYRDRWMVTQ